MRAMLIRDLIIGLRTRALSMVILAHAALLTAFIVLWGGGVPMMPGDNVYEQQRLVQTGLLTFLLPWAAVRCSAAERGDAVVAVSAMTAIKPSRIVIAQAIAHFVLLTVIVLCGLPLMLVAQQMAPVPLRQPLVDSLSALGLAAVAAAAATWWTLAVSDRLGAWLAATATTIAAMTVISGSIPRAALAACLLALSAAATLACAIRADGSLRYLSERQP